MNSERLYRFHDFLRVRVRAERPVYLRYFDREYQGLANNGSSGEETADILLQIGGPEEKTVPSTEIRARRTFNDVLSLTYAVSDLSGPTTRIWVQDHLAARFLPAFIAPIIQASILEPIMYLKCVERGVLILHAATLARDNRGLIVVAPGGTGKTSTALRLSHRDPRWRFLGDDLVFVTPDVVAYNYPRPLHLFQAHVQELPFLELPAQRRWEIALKNHLRRLLQRLYGHKFYLATRVAVQDVLPAVQIQPRTRLSALILLQATGESGPVDQEDPEVLNDFVTTILNTSDLRSIVYQWFCPQETTTFQTEENRLAHQVVAQIHQVWRLNRRDVTADRMARLVDGGESHGAS